MVQLKTKTLALNPNFSILAAILAALGDETSGNPASTG